MRSSVIRQLGGSLLLPALWLAGAPIQSHVGAPKTVAVFAGGCYWGVESVYRHVQGVKSVTSGFALGEGEPAPPAGASDHDEIAEAVRVEYDSTVISYDQLLQIFFTVVHDPTQGDRQGPDVGHRYRSALYTMNDGQRQAAVAFVAKLREGKIFPRPITTVVFPLRKFIAAPNEQQNFAERHPSEPYIQINDVPKLAALKTQFGPIFKER